MGSNFDLKEFFDEFPKVMSEFEKRIDPDLPFFYWTGHQTCYRAFALPSFNEPSAGSVERLDKVRFHDFIQNLRSSSCKRKIADESDSDEDLMFSAFENHNSSKCR